MKGKITHSLKPPLTKRSEEVGYWKLKWGARKQYLRQKHQFLNFWGKTIWGNYGKREKSKWGSRVSNQWNHVKKKRLLLMVENRKLSTLKSKLWTSQIWTLINNFVIVLVCAKCSKLIILEENVISVQQLPLCLPLLFASFPEDLNSGIKSCFDGVVIKYPSCEEYLSICPWCLHL